MLDISKNGIGERLSPKKHASRKMSIVIPYSSEDFLWFNTIYVWEIISDSGEDTRLDNQVIKCPKYEPLQIQESTNRICVNQIFSSIKCFSQSNAFNVKIAFKFLIKYSSSVLFISPPLPLYKCCQNIKKYFFVIFFFISFFLRMRDLSGRNIRKFLKLISKKAFLGPKNLKTTKLQKRGG